MAVPWPRGWLAIPLLGCCVIAGCSPPLSGTYVDVDDASRFYTFSKWSKSWTSYYDQTGTYTVDGDKITIDTGGGIQGRLVSEYEFQLQDVSGWHPDKTFHVYRRAAGTE
jgi:hypothetical protein